MNHCKNHEREHSDVDCEKHMIPWTEAIRWSMLSLVLLLLRLLRRRRRLPAS